MAERERSIRERVEASGRKLGGLKRADRVAAVIITLGGLAVVASVLGILIVIAAEAWPLFRAPQGRFAQTVPLAAPPPLALGVDEYQLYVYVLRSDGRIELFRLTDGSLARGFVLDEIAGAAVASGSRSLSGDHLAAGTTDGRVALARIAFQPIYEGTQLRDLDASVEARGVIKVDAAGRAVRRLDYREDGDGVRVVAAQVGDGEVALLKLGAPSETEPSTDAGAAVEVPPAAPAPMTLRVAAGETITAMALGGTRTLAVGTSQAQVYHWDLSQDPPRLTNVSPAGGEVTALAWALGDVTLLVGTRQGAVSGWFGVRLHEDDTEPAMVRAHDFAAEGSPVIALGPSSRDKSFVALHGDGSVVVHYLTSERTLLHLAGAQAPLAAMVTPKNDGILVTQSDGTLLRYEINVPHPEVTWSALFGKVWYEGYRNPEYVWQSTGATNDFETKFSLVPLIFGTLKGTLYALLFAIPLAVLGAAYTSQFMHPSVRAKVKPTVEIMAALPSVVIGFIAGLYLAPLVERFVVAVLLMMVLLPAFGTAGVLIWKRLPTKVVRRLRPGMELVLILPLLALAAWVSVQVGPLVEAWLFQGDFRLWLASALGLTYDQRNSLVVGLAMGFAVIPIIFTIADDAMSAVPSSLAAGSLALGASRWQTAVRVVLPTASPGIFSAVMVGFGRAVGETMIVLMATGNTPVLDWSIFNGMRTLSANTAVEIPEAPYGSTLYRVLFLSSALLFMMTFAVNTVAEVIRQRLRERYRAL
jgi:phosphate transport system permease protein